MKDKENNENTNGYSGKETGQSGRPPVSFLAPGWETRVSSALDAIGTRKKAAELIGVSTDALQRWIRAENVPSFEAAAAICANSGMTIQWLAFDQGPAKLAETASQSPSQPVRHEELSMAIQLVDEALEGKTLEPAKRAELVALVYEGLLDGLPEAKVLRWARAATK